jgi:uncharacterized protein YndB with AHSA1/START domain
MTINTIYSGETMADIIHRIGIKAPASKVYDAVATAQGVAGWWTRDTTSTGERKLNSRFLRKDGTEVGQMDLELTKLAPSREVQWRITKGPDEWLPTTVTFDLTQDGDTTIVIFGHRDWKEPVEFMAHCSMKWAVFLLSLRQYVETGTGKPSPEDTKIDNWN